jgi:predicted enzyme related to lactoylglutathione lyase
MHKIVMLTVVALVAAVGIHAHQTKASIRYQPTLLVQLPVANLEKSIVFYTEVLGYTLNERRDDLRFAHIATNVPGVDFGVNQVEKPAGSGGIVLNIGVADVAEARKTLEARGVVFDGATTIIPGKVALAGFKDPDGNRLRFAGPPPK